MAQPTPIGFKLHTSVKFDTCVIELKNVKFDTSTLVTVSASLH